MSDQPDSLVVAYLRRLDANVDRLREDVNDMQQRMTALDCLERHADFVPA